MFDDSTTHAPPNREPGRSDIFALRVMQLGAIAVVLAASDLKAFELDRYFVPKEIALHLTALLAGVALFGALRRVALTRTDILLLAYVGISAIAAVFATNHWAAARSLTISASSIAVFFVARSLREAGLARRLLAILAVAVIAGALTSLLQTYGVRIDLFSINRAPGGTLGNRNFVAHLAAFGLPLVMLAALRARNSRAYLLRAVAVSAVLGTLVITRSRAAWLAFAAAMLVFLVAMLLSRTLRRSGRTWARLGGIVALGALGVAAAIFIPNTLRWNSDNPYLDSMKDVANYQEGSGQGRLIQYRQSMVMAARSPLVGVGPGNWSVEYPKHAARNDPSMDRGEAGTTSNPWPSSDWVAFASERGFIATLALALAFLFIALQSLRRLYATSDLEDGLENTTLLATLIAAGIAGAFDAVLLLALPALLLWATLGAIASSQTARPVTVKPAARSAMVVALLLLCAVGVVRSVSQVVAMSMYAPGRTSAMAAAARIDPGNYRIRLQLARSGLRRPARCRHASAARDLFPSAVAAKNVNRSCPKK